MTLQNMHPHVPGRPHMQQLQDKAACCSTQGSTDVRLRGRHDVTQHQHMHAMHIMTGMPHNTDLSSNIGLLISVQEASCSAYAKKVVATLLSAPSRGSGRLSEAPGLSDAKQQESRASS